MRALAALALALGLAACATPPPVGETWEWRAGTLRYGEIVAREFAVVPSQGGPNLPNEELDAALAAALRDLGCATLSPAWVAENVDPAVDGAGQEGVLIVQLGLSRWEDRLDSDGWVIAQVDVRLASDGRGLLEGQGTYKLALTGADLALDSEGRRARALAGLAAQMAEPLAAVAADR